MFPAVQEKEIGILFKHPSKRQAFMWGERDPTKLDFVGLVLP